MAQAKASGCFAVAMDVDAAGLPFLKNMTPPAGSKSVAELAEIVKLAERPFIVKDEQLDLIACHHAGGERLLFAVQFDFIFAQGLVQTARVQRGELLHQIVVQPGGGETFSEIHPWSRRHCRRYPCKQYCDE